MDEVVERLEALETFLFPSEDPLACPPTRGLLPADFSVPRLIRSAANDFFDLYDAGVRTDRTRPPRVDNQGQGCSYEVGLNETAGPWACLPLEWRQFFERTRDARQSEDLVRCLATATKQEDFPASLTEYLCRCRSLALPRECSDTPLFAFDVADGRISPVIGSSLAVPPASDLSRRHWLGMSPKKAHEVDRFTSLISGLLSSTASRPPQKTIDIGSGRAHLSRTLTEAPWELDVLAIDSSASQNEGSAKLAKTSSRQKGKGRARAEETESLPAGRRGRLEHRRKDLDESSILALLQAETSPDAPAFVVALHACGDLTPSLLEAFVTHESSLGRPSGSSLVAVGCCYNLLHPPRSSDLSYKHLQLAAQCPDFWVTSDEEWKRAMEGMTKMMFRARWGVEKRAVTGDPEEPRLRRLPDRVYSSYSTFRQASYERIGFASAPSELRLVPLGSPPDESDPASAYHFRLTAAWTLRALLGPCIESLIVLRRFVNVGKSLAKASTPEGGWRVELRNVFDQRTGSLRNLAIVARPLPSPR